MFGPRNLAPTMEKASRVAVKLGQPAAYTARAKDADALDKVTYQLVGDVPKGAALDPTSGKLTWTPPVDRGPGEVKLTITATDDGLPPLSATQTLTVAIERVGLKLAAISDQKIEAGREYTATPRLSEQDSKRTVSYELVGDAPSDLSFDRKTGRIRWTPGDGEIGKAYKLSLAATDDATPPNRDEKKFQLSVVEPKTPPFALDFNAKHTYLTAIVEVEGQPQAWFLIRPTGESIKLALPVGPPGGVAELRAGNFVGRIVDIEGEKVILVGHGRRLTMHLGKSLADSFALPLVRATN